MTQPASERVQRLCDVCGQLDSDPRHVTAVGPDTPGTVPDNAFLSALPDGVPALAIAELLDPTTVVRHMDCCAAQGCGVCGNVLAGAPQGATGDKLTKHLTSGAANILSDSQPTEA